MHDLVVFGEDWGGHPSSTQHLVRRLAAGRQTLWVNSIGMRRPRFDRRDLARITRKIAGLAGTRRQPAQARRATIPMGMSIVSPIAVPWPGSRTAFHLNRLLLGRQLRARLDACRVRRPVLWTSLPTALPVVGGLGEKAVVYYCGDDFGALAGVDHAPVLAMERKLVERADLVIAASEVLAARFPQAKTLLVPHGVDAELFQTHAQRPADLPDIGPIAGFYGSIADWIDVSLIARTARQLPHWQFVLIGAVETNVDALKDLPNVRLLGPRRHDELPGYVQSWNVSLLPFRACPQIEACNPLKLREYLAAGTPIASTPFPALEPYRNLIAIAAGPSDLAQAILTAVGDADRNPARSSRVAEETWQARAAQIGAVLDNL